MKIFSFGRTVEEIRITIRRFPLVLLSALLGTMAALIIVDHQGPPQPSVLFKVLFASALGIPFLLSLKLFAERRAWKATQALVLQLGGVLLLVLYALSVPADLSRAPAITGLRFCVLLAACHLLVSWLPFAGKGEVNGFWQFNKSVLLRFLTAVLFSQVLWTGLALALAAVTHLFVVEVRGERYLEMWLAIAGIFNTWFFLAGIPDDIAALETATDYPKGLKIFAQYILLPLAFVYAVVLYAYLGKILIDWDWPVGWVSKLILGFSGVGIISVLLLYPLVGHPASSWFRTVVRWFHIVLVPLVVMLFLAVGRRISEYGLTEERYLALVLGAWLAGMVVYMALSRSKSLKAIPLSLCVLAFAVSAGPWGMFSVAESSQIGRLKPLLTRTGILVEGKIQSNHTEAGFNDAKEISAVLDYLHDIHGYGGIQPWFTESLRNDTAAAAGIYKGSAVVAHMMGIEYVSCWQRGPDHTVVLTARQSDVVPIEGYDCLVRDQRIDRTTVRQNLSGSDFFFMMDSTRDVISFSRVQGGRDAKVLEIALQPTLEDVKKKFGARPDSSLPSESLSIAASGDSLKIRVYLRRVELRQAGEAMRPFLVVADILYAVARSR